MSTFKQISISKPTLSIVVPAHNESDGIIQSIKTIASFAKQCEPKNEIIVIDDGSSDNTFELITSFSKQNPDINLKAIKFSRNFGKESAILAGLKSSTGEAVITIDADLQHPPNLIVDMINCWKNGAMIVHGVKRNRDHDSKIAKMRARFFNILFSWLGGIDLSNASDFKLLDRRVVNTIVHQMPECKRFYRGLTSWVGYPSVKLEFNVAERIDGDGKWSLLGLLDLATTALVSFTSAPLRIVTILGFLFLVFGFVIGTITLAYWFMGEAVSGFTTTISTLLIIGSIIMISLGIIGEYISKIYDEIKNRPPYLIESTVKLNENKQDTEETDSN